MKTPDEIKKGLSVCKRNVCTKDCPYHKMPKCYVTQHEEAVAYIQQLEEERDALLQDLKGRCSACDKVEFIDGNPGYYNCPLVPFQCGFARRDCEHWEWRGEKEDEQ